MREDVGACEDETLLSQAQAEWLNALSRCAGVEVYLWKPSDWEAIVQTLTQERTP